MSDELLMTYIISLTADRYHTNVLAIDQSINQPINDVKQRLDLAKLKDDAAQMLQRFDHCHICSHVIIESVTNNLNVYVLY